LITLTDVLQARKVISPYLPRTPLIRYDSLSDLLSAQVYVKHENHLPTNAFKVRGGINLISSLPEEEKERGVITASTGNHAQSIAYASRIFGVDATIAMPENANPLKVEATRRLGANVILTGRDFDESREFVEKLAKEKHLRYVHTANEPKLVAGVATLSLEVFEDLPDAEVIFVPVGGGSIASGACIIANAMNSSVSIIGVQSSSAPAAHRSWKEKRLANDKMETFAEGLATRVGFEYTQRIIGDRLDHFELVSDDEIRKAILMMIEKTHNLAEAAGAASLAGAIKMKEQLMGKKVVLVLSGSNVSTVQLKEILQHHG
jgi:threonine dehydratase